MIEKTTSRRLIGRRTCLTGLALAPAAVWSQETTSGPSTAKGIAVVELFTSQGCSSCPSADATLRQIALAAKQFELTVFVLSFHVDYWNRLGWRDPYSQAAFSDRQREYAASIGSRRVYTPQMIVSGTTEFVGSDRQMAHRAISESLRKAPASTVSLQVEKTDRSVIEVRFVVSGSVAQSVLNLAAVETPEPNDVPEGENAGRRLSHVNVVRAFESVPLGPTSGSTTIKLPAGVEVGQVTVIAYVQRTDSLAITGATASS